MYGLFKRSEIQEWEIKLLKNVISQLPFEFKKLEEHIDAGLLKGVITDKKDYPDYIAFSYHQKILSRFKTEKEKDYRITGIRVFDKKSESHLIYTFYVSFGVVTGYSVKGADGYVLDTDSADVSWFIQLFSKIDRVRKSKND